jgi:5-methylcytosine-specific restriction endonuclease McrA
VICNRYSGCTNTAQYPTGTPGIYACFKHRPSAHELARVMTPTTVRPTTKPKRKTPGIEPSQSRRLMSQCVYCGVALTPDNYTKDHVIPLSRGGGINRENIAPACYDCNHLKGPLTASEFLAVRSDPKALKTMIRRVQQGINE